MTLHRQRNRLICHYCGYSLNPKVICPECQSSSVVGMGVGSERIEAEVRGLFPSARVARLDSDTSRDRKKYLAVLQQVREHEIDILIGTQMIAKGLHFPKMPLVGVVWADSGLGMPDYKAAERSFQLLAQVTGRAGRGEHPGRVIIQTYQPQHYVIEFARKHEYEKLYEQEVMQREGLWYPPFGRLVNIKLSSEKEPEVAQTGKQVAEYLRSVVGAGKGKTEILGPAPAPLSMLRNRYRWQLLLKSSNPARLHQLCDLLLGEQQKLCAANVRMGVDVDPENMM